MTDQNRARGRAGTWPDEAGAARGPVWPAWPPDFLRTAAERLAQWAALDVAPGRLVPWLPVAFGLGIALYFTAEREPAVWASSGLSVLLLAGAVLVRRRPVALPVMLGLAAIALGFATA